MINHFLIYFLLHSTHAHLFVVPTVNRYYQHDLCPITSCYSPTPTFHEIGRAEGQMPRKDRGKAREVERQVSEAVEGHIVVLPEKVRRRSVLPAPVDHVYCRMGTEILIGGSHGTSAVYPSTASRTNIPTSLASPQYFLCCLLPICPFDGNCRMLGSRNLIWHGPMI